MEIVFPILEYADEFMVGHNDMFVYVKDSINIVQQTSQNGTLSDGQQWFVEVMGQPPSQVV